MPRTLKPEDRIAHYRIVGALEAGGMGKVYRAQDRTLERSAASVDGMAPWPSPCYQTGRRC